MRYPQKGDTISVTVDKQEDVLYLALYEVVEGDGKNSMTLEFKDIRVVKESDIPF